MPETPAQRLQLARVAAGYRTAREFSDKHDIPQSTYALHESGGRKIQQQVADKYANLLGNVSASWILYREGRGPGSIGSGTFGSKADEKSDEFSSDQLASVATATFHIVGTVEAGAWRTAIELPREEWEPVAFEDRPEYRGAQRFGLRVRGMSMNRFYQPGTILDCVRFIGISRRPREGDHVIVYRRGPGDLVEATVKELVRSGERWELWPRSTHPAYQAPMEMNGSPDAEPENGDEHEDIRIVGLVIGSYQRRG